MKITRRTLAVSAAAAAVVAAQNPAAIPPASDEELLRAAREQVQRNGEALAKFTVPAALEPAFQFKA